MTVGGKTVHLTPTEYRLLLTLVHNYEDSPSNVKAHIWQLRRKIEANPGRPRCIRTQRGVGYYMARN